MCMSAIWLQALPATAGSQTNYVIAPVSSRSPAIEGRLVPTTRPGLADPPLRCLADPGDIGGRTALEALDVRIRLQDFLGLLIRGLRVIEALVLVADHLHVGIGRQLALDPAVHPLVVRLGAEAADEDRILALFAINSAKCPSDRTVGLVVEGLDVVMHTNLVRGLMVTTTMSASMASAAPGPTGRGP